jgi:trehalose 6-phosphate phosphatase
MNRPLAPRPGCASQPGFLYWPEYLTKSEPVNTAIETYAAGATQGRSAILSERLSPSDLAFFLDVDGTLIDIAPTPDAVVVDADLLAMLRTLVLASRGAVALVSGRTINTLDELFGPLVLPCAGLHGFERRAADGTYHRKPLPPGHLLSQAREELAALLVRYPEELLIEDKRFAVALHFRKAPQLESVLVREITDIVTRLGADFELQRGRCVAEIRPARASKAGAIADFMREPPFRGRRALCLGDDLTDECAFEWVNAAGGLSIAVGVERESAAQAHLHSVAAARLWLHRLLTPVR